MWAVQLGAVSPHAGQRLGENAVERIGLDGFDPVFGARPLKRAIQREIVDRVAEAMIDGDVHEGSAVTVDQGDDGELTLAA